MARSHLDHITLTAPSLAAGVEYVHQTLGVMPQVGGAPADGYAQLFPEVGPDGLSRDHRGKLRSRSRLQRRSIPGLIG